MRSEDERRNGAARFESRSRAERKERTRQRLLDVTLHLITDRSLASLSLREVQEIMAERGVIVSHEGIRAWSQKFGQAYANGLRRGRPRPGGKWHLDEVFIKVNGQRHYLWRAVDQHGNVPGHPGHLPA